MAATTLRKGQVAVVGYNTGQTDSNGTTVDSMEFVLLTAIGSGTVIRFTDRSWNGTGFTSAAGDGSFAFTAATDLAAGTVIQVTFTGGNAVFTINGAAAGSVSAGGFDLQEAGDAIYVYQGSDANTPTTFLSATEIGDGNTTFTGSLANTGLVAGVHAVSTSLDSATYSGPTTQAFAHFYNGEQLLENIMDSSNWVGDDADLQKALDQPSHNGPYNVAPDVSFWIGGQGGGNALVHVGGDATVNSGQTGYNLTQLYNNLLISGNPVIAGARDIAFDTVEGKFFVAEGERILQGNIADLLGNPSTPVALTVLFTGTKPDDTVTTFGDNNIFNLEVDTVNNIIYFSHGSQISKIGYNTANQTQTILADFNVGNPTAGSNRNHVDDFVIHFPSGTIYASSHRITSGQDGDQLTKNYIYKITGLDPADGANAFTFANGAITFLPFSPDDDDATNGFTWAPGEAFPQEEGTLEGLAISPDGLTLYFTAASTLYDHDGDGGIGGGNGTAPQLRMGGVFSYALTGNANGTYTQIWQQLDDGDTNSQAISNTFGPQGLLDDIEVDPVTGTLYFLDQTGDQLGTTNPPGDEGIWRINPNGTGLAYFANINNINAMGPSSIWLNRAPTVTSSSQATPGVTEASKGTNSGATALVQPFTALDVTDVESASNPTQQLAGATVWISNNFQSGSTHQDTLTINGTQSGTVNGITYSYNAATGAMSLTGITTFNNYEATIALVRFNTSGDDPTAYGQATSRTISWAVSDGLNHSDPVSTTVSVTGINDAPVNTPGAAMNFNEDTTGNTASAPPVNVVTGISVFDVDADPATQDIIVTLSVGVGTLTIRTDVVGGLAAGEVAGNGTNTLVLTGTQNQINATLAAVNGSSQANGLVYTPPANYNGATSLTITTNDQGFNGNDPGVSGTGSSEQDVDVKVINVADVNDAPTVGGDGTENSPTILEDTPFTNANAPTVATLFGGQFSDALDVQVSGGNPTGSPGDTFAGIAIVADGSAPATGQWEYWNGAAWLDIGAASQSAARTFSANTQIRFNPALNYNGPAPTLTVHLIESGGPAITDNGTVNLSPVGTATGGTTVYSTNTVLLSQSITAVNDAPVNTVGSAMTVAEDSGATNVTGMSIADVDANPATSIFTVTLDVLHGTLNLSTAVAGGVTAGNVSGNNSATVVLTGTINQVNATLVAAGGLTYTPTGNYNGSDRVRITTNDGGATGQDPGLTGTATSEQDQDSKAITVTAVNDPVTGTAPATATLDEDSINVAITGMSISDVDAALAPAGVYEVTLTGTNGTMSLTTITGLTFSAGDGTSDATMTFHGTLAAINTALASAKYTPTPDFAGAATITLFATDTFGAVVATGTGAATNDTDVINVTVNDVADSLADFSVRTRLTQLITDQDGDNVADTGDVLRTTLTFHNTGIDALDVSVQDLLNGLTVVGGSVKIGPMALDDSATISGNTPQVFTFAELLGNDIDPDGPEANLTITGVSGAVNGTVSINIGAQTVTFTPNTGYTGPASFQYSIQDAQGLSNVAGFEGTVNVTVDGLVWYVDSAAAPGGDGSFTSPFQTLAPLSTGGSADALDGADDIIFVYDRGAQSVGSIVLENGQDLLGDSVALVVNGIAIGASTNNSDVGNGVGSGVVVTLASNNTITGLDLLGNAGSTALSGTNFGALNVSSSTIDTSGQAIALTGGSITGTGFTSTSSDSGANNVSLTNVSGSLALGSGALIGATGASLNIVNSTGSPLNSGLTYAGTITQNNNAALLNVDGGTGGHSGSITLDGALAATNGTGLQFNNADGTYDFNGQITLNGGNAGIDIFGGSGGTFTFDHASNAITHNNAGDAFEVRGTGAIPTNANVTWTGAITDNNGNAVFIDEHDAGTITFQGGTISSTGSGIDILNSSGGTVNFTSPQITLSTGANAAVNITNNGAAINFTGGSLDILTTGGAGLSANATGGSVTVTGDDNTVSTGAGIAVNIQGTDIGAGGVRFDTVNTSGASSGIILANTGAGAFTVVGTTGVNGSGGSILNSTGNGIDLTGTTNVSLTGVTITGSGGSGIHGSNVNGLSLTNVTSSTNGNAVDEGGVFIINASGNFFVTNSTFNANADDNFAIRNDTGSLNLRVTGSSFTFGAPGALSDDNLILQANNTANITALITGSTFTNADGDHFQFATNASASGFSNITFSSNTLTNNQAGTLGSGVTISPSGSADLRFLASGNNITGTVSGFAINMNAIDTTSAALIEATVQNNTIGASGVAGSGPDQSGAIQGRITGAGTMNLLIDNNDIFNWGNGSAVDLSAADGVVNGETSVLNATLTNNLVAEPGASTTRALLVGAGASAGTYNNIIRILLDNNQFDNVNYPGLAGGNDMRFTVFSNAQIQTPGYVGGVNDVAAFAVHMQNQNAPGTGTANAAVGAGTSAFHNTPSGANPTLPTTPTLPPASMLLAPEPPVTPPADDSDGKDDHAGELPPPADDTGAGSGGKDDHAGDLPDVASHPVVVDNGVLSQAELDYLVDAAIERWIAAGASAEQVAAMRSASFSVADMTGVQLGMSDGSTIYVDNDGGRAGWFLDTTPDADEEYAGTGTRLTATGGAAAEGVDLLTVLMHELGHQAGLGDTYDIAARDDLMYGYAYEGERRLPADGQAAGATPGSVPHPVFQLGPIAVGTVPGDNAFTVQYDSTVNAPTEDRLVQYFSNDADISWRDAPAGPLFTASTNSELLTVDSLNLGDRIFLDANENGLFDAGDTGIANVSLTLFADTNNNGVYDDGVDQAISFLDDGDGVYEPGTDTPVAAGTAGAITLTVTTDANGFYAFNFLAPGDYIVRLDASNFLSGGALENLAPSGLAADPNNNTDNDNNGQSFTGYAATRAIRLDYNQEPTAGPGNDTNNTLDVGFIQPELEPTLTAVADNPTFTENGSAVDLFDSVDASTVESGQTFTSMTLTVTNVTEGAGERLSFDGSTVALNNGNVVVTAGNGLTVSVSVTGTVATVSFSGAALSEATLEGIIDAMTYVNASDDPAEANRVVTITQLVDSGSNIAPDDNTASLSVASTVTVVAVNDPPVGSDNTVTGSEDDPYTFAWSDFGFSDPVDGNGPLSIIITTLPAQGDLEYNGTPIVAGDLPLEVSKTDIDNNLLTFVPDPDTFGAGYATFDFRTRDDGGTANGGDDISDATYTITIDIEVDNIPPALDLDADDSVSGGTGYATAFTEGGSAVAISDTDVSITDGDAGDDIVSATITITNAAAGDLLTVGTLPATVSVDLPNSSATTIVLTAAPGTSADDFEAAIEAITYSNTGDNPTANGTNTSRSIAVTVNDGADDSNVATTTVAITDVNDPPTGTNATITAIEDTPRVLAIADFGFVDDGTLASVTISAVTGGTIFFDSDGGGAGAPAAVSLPQTFTAAQLNGGFVTFVPPSNVNGASAGSITFTVTDDDGVSDPSANTLTADISAANDSPVLTTSSPVAATEQTAVAILPAASVADIDLDARNGGNGDYAGAVFSVNRSPAANVEDLFTLVAGANFTIDGTNLKTLGGQIFGHISTNANGLISIAFTSLEAIATSALADQVIQSVRYTNSSDNPPASVVLAVSFNDGSPGGGQGGGASALDVDLVTVNIAAVNDAPVNSLGGTIGTNEDAIDAWLSGMSIADPDANPATDLIVVTFNVQNGTLDIRTDVAGGVGAGAVTGDDTDTITVTATLNQINATLAATNGLTYSPDPNFNGNDTLTVTTNDQGATGSGGSKVDIDTRTITVSPQADAPVAQPDAVSTAENAIGTGSLFANNGSGPDTDADGDTITISAVNGSAANVGVEITLASGAKLTVNANGSYSYNPNGKFTTLTDNTSGAVNTSTVGDTFNYTVAGGNTVTVTVTVNGVAGPGDRLMGDGTNNTITGTPQVDTFVLGQGGNDTISALAGNDIIYFGGALTADDNVTGGADVDTVVLQGNYSAGLTLDGSFTGVERISMLAGNNTAFGDPGTNLYDYVLTIADANFAAGLQVRINGSALLPGEDFTFDGSAETDAKFVIYGGRGTDHLTGGSGHDIFFFAEAGRFAAGDVVNGGDGYDGLFLRGNYTIDFNQAGYAGALVNLENLTLSGAADERYGRGGGTEFDYVITWDDDLLGAGGTMTINGATLGAQESLTFNGANETNGLFRLFGGAGNDVLVGGGGADLILGGLRGDTLTGGAGNDTFRYDSVADSNSTERDSIQDFNSGDLIDLSRIDANELIAGNQAFTFIGGAAFSGAAGQLRFENISLGGTSWLIQGDTNGDGVSDFELVLVINPPDPITSGDFIL